MALAKMIAAVLCAGGVAFLLQSLLAPDPVAFPDRQGAVGGDGGKLVASAVPLQDGASHSSRVTVVTRADCLQVLDELGRPAGGARLLAHLASRCVQESEVHYLAALGDSGCVDVSGLFAQHAEARWTVLLAGYAPLDVTANVASGGGQVNLVKSRNVELVVRDMSGIPLGGVTCSLSPGAVDASEVDVGFPLPGQSGYSISKTDSNGVARFEFLQPEKDHMLACVEKGLVVRGDKVLPAASENGVQKAEAVVTRLLFGVIRFFPDAPSPQTSAV